MLEESSVVQDWLRRGRKEGLEQGEKLLVTRQLTKRFGRLSVKTKNQIERLSLKQIEKLSDALLDFKEKSELNAWLEKHSR